MTLPLLLLLACAPAWNLDTDSVAAAQKLNLLQANRFVPRCAPREWALAKSHEEFARVSLSHGDGNAARRHLDDSLRWSDEAIAKAIACAPGDSDGDAMEDDLDQCPQAAEDYDGDRDQDGCPDVDSDGDGMEDDKDQCPKESEDLDGFKDSDGCADPDNDADGVADEADRCPVQAEVVNEYMDEDGCPDVKPERIVLSKKKIEILEKVNFKLGAATIESSSFALLDEVARAIQDNPDIRVRIEGHTDNEGDDDFNLRLSQSRAESVKTYMSDRGIDPARLDAVGFGEERPIDTNRTDEGRANNRRVEFVILRVGE